MATYQELFTNTTNEYSARLFADPKCNTATAYVVFNQDFEIRFGFVDPHKQQSTDDCYNTNCIDRNTNKPVVGITACLFCPSEDVVTWQLDLMYETGQRDTLVLTPTGNRYKNCVATTEVLDIQTLLDSSKTLFKPTNSILDNLKRDRRNSLSTRDSNKLQNFLNNLDSD